MGSVADIDLIGGHLALDFVNTCGGLPDGPNDEYLFSYPDLLTWMRGAQQLEHGTVEQLQHVASQQPAAAETAFQQALRLRASLDAILRATITNAPPSAADLAVTARAYRDALAPAALASPRPARFRWEWPRDAIEMPLWVLAPQVINLLQTAPLELLRRCDHCRWLFLDTSRNHTRRWCRMNACGSIEKMRRYRAAHRQTTGQRR